MELDEPAEQRQSETGALLLAAVARAGLGGTSFTDFDVVSGTRYHYIVRATDLLGNTEANLVRRYETPAGALAPGSFSDNAGDTGTAQFIPSPTPNNSWTIRATDARHYATNTQGIADYPTSACSRLSPSRAAAAFRRRPRRSRPTSR